MRAVIASLLVSAMVVAAPALAADAARAPLKVEGAWARATAPGATVGAVYLVIDNRAGRSDRLLSVSSPRASRTEVHATVRDVDVVRMRRIDPLHVPAEERVVLEPGGTHVMLMGLKAPLKEGETIPLNLKFELAGSLTVNARVVAPTAGSEDAGHGGHH